MSWLGCPRRLLRRTRPRPQPRASARRHRRDRRSREWTIPLSRTSLLVVMLLLLGPPGLRAEEIPLVKKGGVYQLPVEINGVLTLHFILDTGAADVNIPADVALTLVRTGTIRDTDFLPGQTYTLADGSTVKSARFLLRSLKIGQRRVANVAASIGPVSSALLLGQTFLEKLGAWGMDSQRQVLTLGTPGQQKKPPPPQRSPRGPEGPQVARGDAPSRAASRTWRNSIGMEFVLIPAGTFQMGAGDSDTHMPLETPVHTVRLTQPFYLGKYEVTQGQWQTVMGINPSKFTGDLTRPVERVSWDDVQEFIRRLNAREGGATYRLPTEAEWEYAARAGTTTPWSFGEDPSQLGRYAWYNENAGGQTHPVGQLLPNAWGLYDMYGNVAEWVQDWYGLYASGTAVDPAGPSSGSMRAARGGSWYSGSWYSGALSCRSASRLFYASGFRDGYLGVRLLRTAQ